MSQQAATCFTSSAQLRQILHRCCCVVLPNDVAIGCSPWGYVVAGGGLATCPHELQQWGVAVA